jgi:hypothetical protein
MHDSRWGSRREVVLGESVDEGGAGLRDVGLRDEVLLTEVMLGR